MKKLIIIDDEPIIRNGLYSEIDWESINVHPLTPASCGDEAVKICQKFSPDIAIVDISLPDISGLELIQIMRKNNPDMKCIILSGYDNFEYAQKAIDIKVNKYLLKPADPEEILLSVKSLLFDSGSQPEKSDVTHIENVSSSPFDNNIIIDEIILYLKEFYSNKIVFGDLAKRYRISASHLSTTFKKLTGISITDYLCNIRVSEAKKLLIETNLRINEISRKVGIDDELYFSRIFRKSTGLSPKQYRIEYSSKKQT